jgi:hypothetical protein
MPIPNSNTCNITVTNTINTDNIDNIDNTDNTINIDNTDNTDNTINIDDTDNIDNTDNTDNTVIPNSLSWLHLKRNVSGDNLTMLENSGMASSTTSGTTSAILEIENRFKLIIEPSPSTLGNLNTPYPNCLSTDQNN